MSFVYQNIELPYPIFTNELIEECTQSRDFRPILFEWYKFVGIFCNTAASISRSSLAVKKIPSVHYAVLIGLLNRCSRLMLSNIRLSSTGKYGETTRLLDRSISESAIKVQWLCHKDNNDSFTRYLADGLKKDLILKRQIDENILNRKGKILIIEQRMLSSINRCVQLSKLSEQDIMDAKGLPNFSQMCNNLNLNDFFYTVIQRMGSHAVHGTWSDLIFNYLHNAEQEFCLKDHEIETQDAQFIIVIRILLQSIRCFLNYICPKIEEISEFIETIESVDKKIIEIQNLAWKPDFDEN